ncbi:MAG: PEP-CTERM sorting domain-containing protein [Candidatus Thiodiazotropha sp.]
MKRFIVFTLLGLLLSAGTANALPLFSHSEDSSGFMLFTADATNEPSDMVTLDIFEMIGVEMLGGDLGAMRGPRDGLPGYLHAIDETPDDLISFLFEPTLSGDAGYRGRVTYSDQTVELFTYYLPSTDPNDLPPTSSVPEPSTFLLLGAGLIGMAGARARKTRR